MRGDHHEQNIDTYIVNIRSRRTPEYEGEITEDTRRREVDEKRRIALNDV